MNLVAGYGISAVLDGAATGAEPTACAQWEDTDLTNSKKTYDQKETTLTSDTTVCIVEDPDTNHVRKVLGIQYNNKDTTGTVKVTFARAAISSAGVISAPLTLQVLTLATLENATYSPEHGWTCFTTAGQRKHTIT